MDQKLICNVCSFSGVWGKYCYKTRVNELAIINLTTISKKKKSLSINICETLKLLPLLSLSTEAGGYFGELALVTHKPRAASAYAVGPTRVACKYIITG